MRTFRVAMKTNKVAVYAGVVTVVLAFTLFSPRNASVRHAPAYDGAPIEQPLFLADETHERKDSPGWADTQSASATRDGAAAGAHVGTAHARPAHAAPQSDADSLFPISGQHRQQRENPEVVMAPPSPSPAPVVPWDLEVAYAMDAPNDRICRVRSACLAADGAMVMRQLMRKHQPTLRACGIGKFRFVDNLPRITRLDLIGHVPMRWHMPHFATDLLPTLYAHEVLRPSFTREKTRKTAYRTCYLGNKKARGKECGSEEFLVALYADKRIESLSPTAWVRELIKLYPWFPHIAYKPKKGQLTCHKSIVAYPRLSVGRNWRGWYGPRNPLYLNHDIRRDSVLVRSEGDDAGACTVNVKVINRNGWALNGNFQVGRDIINIPEIKRDLEAKADRKKLGVNFEVVQFEGKSFKEQMQAVQDADVILGAHGAGLANLIFARLDASLIEVFPFGYRPIAYRRLALAMHMKYIPVMAEPDDKYVLQCVKQAAKSSGLDVVKTSGTKTWKVAVDAWKAARRLILKAEDFHGDKATFLIKSCIRSQRMYLFPSSTAKLLVDEVERICKARDSPLPPPIYPHPPTPAV